MTPGLEKGTRIRGFGVTSVMDIPVARPVGRRYGIGVSICVSKLISKSSLPPQVSIPARSSIAHYVILTRERCKRFAVISRWFKKCREKHYLQVKEN